MTATPSVIVTAGYNYSPAASALIQLLPRDGVRVAGVLLVTPFAASRVAQVLRAKGLDGLIAAAGKAFGVQRQPLTRRDPVEAFFEENELSTIRLDRLARQNGVPFARVSSLDSNAATAFIDSVGAGGVLYCGGGIVRQPFLQHTRGMVLNAHAGPLPYVRGMNAAEWSVLFNLEPCTTIHFIDRGIDTGPTVTTIPVPIEAGEDVHRLRQKTVVAGISGLRAAVRFLGTPPPPRSSDALDHKQVFTLSRAMSAYLEKKLTSNYSLP